MTISDELALAMAGVTAATAIAAARWVGRGDEKSADRAAVEAMRAGLNALAIKGRIVIGEGERDDAPMLHIGEDVGSGGGSALDLAVDPLEGTTLAAKAMPDAMSVIALAPRGGLLHAPDVYMDKLAIGPGFERGLVDLDNSAADNVRALARAKGVSPEQIGVCVLDRPRHGQIIESLRSVGARVHLITDGDIAAIINCAKPATGIDMYLGQGGAPEGVLAAAALKCAGGQFQARLIFRNDDERARAERGGLTDFKRRYTLDDLAPGEVALVATGVTGSALLDGVRAEAGAVSTHTLVMNSATGAVTDIRVRRNA